MPERSVSDIHHQIYIYPTGIVW